MRRFINSYVAETGETTVDLRLVAEWAIRKGLWEPPKINAIRHLARDLSRAARQDYIEDENGEPVRRMHAYTVKCGDQQMTFWVGIESGTPHQIRLSAQQRRNGILLDCFQLERDVRYYNNHHNPGDPVPCCLNFEPDIAEKRMPTDYPEAPPEGEEEDEGA